VSLLRRLRPSPLSSSALTPASALTYSSWAADWAGLYSDIRAIIRAALPPVDFAFAAAALAFETSLQVKIPDVLTALGEEIAYFAVAQPGAPNEPRYTLLLAVKDAKRLGQVMDSAVAKAQNAVRVESTGFLGYEIKIARPQLPAGAPPNVGTGADQTAIAWVLADDFLAISGLPDPLKDVLQLKAGKRTDNLASAKSYRQARALLPEKVDTFEFTEVGALGEMVLGQLAEAAKQPEVRNLFGEVFDFASPLPAATARRYFGLAASCGLIEAAGLASVIVLSAPQPFEEKTVKTR